MNKIGKIISTVLVFVTLFTYTAFADNKVENNPSVQSSAEVDINKSDYSFEPDVDIKVLYTGLRPGDNNDLEKEVSDTLEKHSDNWFVKFFKTIIDAISSFLDALFKLASEAAKIGVE